MHDRASALQSRDVRVGVIRHVIAKDQRAIAIAFAADRSIVLDRYRQAFQRACLAVCVPDRRLVRLLQRFVEVAIGKRIDRRLERLRAGYLCL